MDKIIRFEDTTILFNTDEIKQMTANQLLNFLDEKSIIQIEDFEDGEEFDFYLGEE